MMRVAGWGSLFVVVAIGCVVDLLAHRRDRTDSPRRAALWSGAWVATGIAFGGWIAVSSSGQDAEEYFAAYLLEKSLSLDNLLVFLFIFRELEVDPVDQRKVLFWGIAGALLARGLFIAIGVEVVAKWHVVLVVFGALLVVLAWRMAFGADDDEPPRVVAWLRRHLRYAPGVRRRFFVRQNGRVHPTSLAFALVAIESSDLLFAVDSIPTAFAVTSSAFVLYSSNVLAVLGLRALFLVATGWLARLRTLRWGLAALLVLAGAKLIASPWWHVPIALALGLIVACLAVTFVADRVAARSHVRA